jgi:hypothetical protein
VTALNLVVLLASTVGTVASAALLVDAIIDHRVARAAGDHALVSIARQHIVAESIRLGVVLIFLGAVILVLLLDDPPGEVILWGLALVPVLAMTDGVYAWIWRRVQFKALRGH